MAPMECISAFGGWEGFAVSECRQEIRGLASWCVIRLRRKRVFGIEIEDCVRDDDPCCFSRVCKRLIGVSPARYVEIKKG